MSVARIPKTKRWRAALCALILLGLVGSPPLAAFTLSELVLDSKMTPKKFAGKFEDFEYEFSREIQPPSVFLSTKRGDCDDYATLADTVLRRKGFDTHLIQIRLAGQVDHAVCYVTQSTAYLDYNNRAVFLTLARSGASIREIATKVAASLNLNWTSAFEFTYDGDKKEVIATVVKTEPPASDPKLGQSAQGSVKVGF